MVMTALQWGAAQWQSRVQLGKVEPGERVQLVVLTPALADGIRTMDMRSLTHHFTAHTSVLPSPTTLTGACTYKNAAWV